MRGGGPAYRVRAPRSVRGALRSLRPASEIEAEIETERTRLVRQVADARQEPALAVQRQKGQLVGQVVDVEREVPDALADTETQVDEVVGGQLRIERERVLRQRAPDRVLAVRRDVHDADSRLLV